MDVIFSWQWTRKCGNSTCYLYQSVSNWNIRIPYQSETDSLCWMQHTFATLTNKAPVWNSFSFFFCLMTPRQSIERWLFARPVFADPSPATSPIHRTPFLQCIILSPKLLFSIVPVRPEGCRSCWQLTGYIGFILCYFTLLYFIYDVSFFLSSTLLLLSRSSFPFNLSFLTLYFLSSSSSFFLRTVHTLFSFSYWHTPLQTTDEVMDS